MDVTPPTEIQTPDGRRLPVRPEWGEARAKTVHWFDPPAAAAAGLSGLEVMRATIDGTIAAAPMDLLLQMWPTAAEAGRVVFGCRPDRSMYNTAGVVQGGLVCTMLDSAAACAVWTTLEAGFGFTSIDITVNFLRPVTVASGPLVATGIVTKPGRRVALATAEVVDAAGKTVAVGSSNCLIIPPAD
jgi:uncharacterized protein (TIGR00369 family)